jgi:hypothetical protein
VSVRKLETPVCENTVKALEELLARARCGEIRGLAYIAIEPRWCYTADATGVARDNLTFTRGAILMLGNRLAQLVLDQQGNILS